MYSVQASDLPLLFISKNAGQYEIRRIFECGFVIKFVNNVLYCDWLIVTP